MSDALTPADQQQSATGSSLTAPGDAAGGPMLTRLRSMTGSPGFARVVPLALGAGVIGAGLLAWATLAPSSQRLLYDQLADQDRASVIAVLDQAGVGYTLDNATGALSVDEADYYRARMLVAGDGGVAAPESGIELLDGLPMGASRALEGERMRAARERDLMLTIREIDGVESVRVHLAEAEKSVFVRDSVAPTASVMLRLARGRQLTESQVAAIVNLVAGSVPGLSPDAVRVIDQQGQLLSDGKGTDSDRLDLQTRLEHKLRTQVTQLLTPILGEGAFSTEVQVELNMDEVTSARESYDKDGVVRTETTAESTSTTPGTASGIPGALSNTPPPAAQPQQAPPQGTNAAPGASGTSGETSATRTYELGREVSVANTGPGAIKRLSVAVALSKEAMKGAKAADVDQLRQLVSAAVGANEARGDKVAVVSRAFEPVTDEAPPFYEAPWFAMAVRYGAAVLALLLVLLLGLKPVLKALRPDKPAASEEEEAAPADPGDPPAFDPEARLVRAVEAGIDRTILDEKVGLARRLIAEQPDSAVAALRLMLADNSSSESARAGEGA